MPPALDPATLLAVVAKAENHLRELERRTGECSLCHSADLRRLLGELRQMLAEASGQVGATVGTPVGAGYRRR